ncbi:tumor necrosis factor receptor superfamily member 5 isoform X2 [Denticeps clupeoides]|uniref:tumor necrosis factor receptor superfamily member 5 isoform X2 n=1 Tax=Denticeps clupeoides TaxID=299321 RepID=UPI0010A43AFD|nr:tumor necrosis factor receptor superfamily member 5-like isoform X2 [Denticeps clupeoides]
MNNQKRTKGHQHSDSPVVMDLLSMILLTLIPHLSFSYPVRQIGTLCDPGYRLAKGRSCVACGPNTYTDKRNAELLCFRCSRDCKAEFNMDVEEKCTSVSDVKCRCKPGYECTRRDSSNKCDLCEKPRNVGVPGMTSAVPPCGFGLYFSSRLGRCENHIDCVAQGLTINQAGNSTHNTICGGRQNISADSRNHWLLGGLVLGVGVFSLIFLISSRSRGEEVCFKLMKWFTRRPQTGEVKVSPQEKAQCCQETQSHSCSSAASDHGADRPAHRLFNTEPAPSPPGALGPLHIYQPGTIFVSLLNQFESVLAGGGGERAERGRDGRQGQTSDCSSPSSPTPLSEEERSREGEFIFFPSQEQGKESHMSKEEGD